MNVEVSIESVAREISITADFNITARASLDGLDYFSKTSGKVTFTNDRNIRLTLQTLHSI